MSNINKNETIILLLSGQYHMKESLAREILAIERENGDGTTTKSRIIGPNDFVRMEEAGRTLRDSIRLQQGRRIPSIYYSDKSLKDEAKNMNNVIHINILEDEAACKLEIPEMSLTLNNKDFRKLACDIIALSTVYSNVLDSEIEKI